jgi:hypothetical protein
VVSGPLQDWVVFDSVSESGLFDDEDFTFWDEFLGSSVVELGPGLGVETQDVMHLVKEKGEMSVEFSLVKFQVAKTGLNLSEFGIYLMLITVYPTAGLELDLLMIQGAA